MGSYFLCMIMGLLMMGFAGYGELFFCV
jgi:hypothetical protein